MKATEEEVNDFLEHFGKKGMKWGVRKSRTGDWSTRSGAQKAGLVTGAVAGVVAGGAIANRLLGGRAPVLVTAANVAGGIVGARLTRNLLQKEGKKTVSSLPTPQSA